jgi:hypothetical protein
MRDEDISLSGGSALGAAARLSAGGAGAGHQDRRRRPDHRPERRLRRAAEERRRAGGRGHQRRRRRARPEAQARESATTPAIPSRASRSPTSSRHDGIRSSSATSTRRRRSRPPKSMPRTASCRSPRPRPTRRSPSAACGTCSAPAAATTSRAPSPATISPSFKGKKIAIVHDKSTYGKGLADETKKALNKAGIKEVIYEGVNTGEKDFTALVSKMKAPASTVVYCRRLHTEAA